MIFKAYYSRGHDSSCIIEVVRLPDIPGMDHDLPAPLVPTIIEAFETLVQQEKNV